MKAYNTSKAQAVLCVWAIALIGFGSPSNAAADELVWPVLNGTVDTDAASGPLPARLQASEKRQEGTSTIEFTLNINLSPLRQRLAAQLALPKDNCRSFSADNVVAEGETAVLSVEDGKLRLDLNGNFSLWHCLENPIPNSKVEWQVKSVGFGVKTKVPVVVTWPGSPIKNKLSVQPYTASSLFTLQLGSAGTVEAKISSKLQVESMGSQNGRNTLEEALQRPSANLAILLEKISTVESLLKLLPAEYREPNLAVKSAVFATRDGDPVVSLAFEVRLSAAQADILKRRLFADPPPTK